MEERGGSEYVWFAHASRVYGFAIPTRSGKKEKYSSYFSSQNWPLLFHPIVNIISIPVCLGEDLNPETFDRENRVFTDKPTLILKKKYSNLSN